MIWRLWAVAKQSLIEVISGLAFGVHIVPVTLFGYLGGSTRAVRQLLDLYRYVLLAVLLYNLVKFLRLFWAAQIRSVRRRERARCLIAGLLVFSRHRLTLGIALRYIALTVLLRCLSS